MYHSLLLRHSSTNLLVQLTRSYNKHVSKLITRKVKAKDTTEPTCNITLGTSIRQTHLHRVSESRTRAGTLVIDVGDAPGYRSAF